MTASEPMVSVTIIFLNTGKFLQDAIESVLAQTYNQWELFLVDDGSTDDSTKIAKEYEARYPERIRYLEHEAHQNRGMSASRNLGIRQSQGEFVALLDADDMWLPTKLEKQIAILKRFPEVGLIVNPAFYLHEDGRQRRQPMTLAAGFLEPGEWIPEIIDRGQNAACPACVVMRRDLALRLGGFEESFRGMYEDQMMWFKVSVHARVYFDPECLALCRIHSTSFCATTPLDQHALPHVSLYAKLLKFLRSRKKQIAKGYLLRTMARSKLCTALLAYQELMSTRDRTGDDPLSEAVLSSARRELGVVYGGVLMLGGRRRDTALALCRKSVHWCRRMYRISTFGVSP